MLKKSVIIAMLAVTFNAHATGNEGNGCIGNCPSTTDGGTTTSSATSSAVAGAMALSGAAAFGGGGYARSGDSNAIGGNSTLNNNINIQGDNNDRIIPASSAIAPSIISNTICPIVSPTSHAVQFLVFGGSTTGAVTINSICVAYHLGQVGVVERMACNKDKEYAKANPNCAVK